MKVYEGTNLYQAVKLHAWSPVSIGGLEYWWNSRRLDSMSLVEASIQDDLTVWAETDLAVTGSGPHTLTIGSGSATHFIQAANGIDVASGQVATFSIDVLTSSTFTGWFRLYLNGLDAQLFYDLDNHVSGTTTGVISESIVPISGGYRITVTFLTTGETGAFRLQATTGDNTGYNFSDPGATIVVDNVTLTQQDRLEDWSDLVSSVSLEQAALSEQPQVQNGVVFDGADDNLETNVTLSTLRELHQECTVFVVADRTSVASGEYLVSTAGSTATGSTGFSLLSNGTDVLRFTVTNGSGSTRTVNATSGAGDWSAGKHIVTAGLDASTFECRIDGVTEMSGASGAIGAGDPSIQLTVGNAATPIAGTVYEVLIFYRLLTTVEMQQVEAYLTAKHLP